VVVLAWFYFNPPPQALDLLPAPTIPIPNGVERLVLLGELETRPAARTQPETGEDATASPQAVDSSGGSDNGEEPAVTGIDAEPEQVADSQVASTAAPSTEPSDTAMASKDTASGEVEAESVTQAGLSPSIEPDAAATTSTQSVSPVASQGTAFCMTLGPIPLTTDPKEVDTWFRQREVVTRLREVEERKKTATWVYLPPLASYQAARAMIEEHRKKQVKDFLLINRGEWKNAISLGLYAEETSVQRRLAVLQKKGFQVFKQPRFRVRKSYWLDIRTTTESGVMAEVLQGQFAAIKSIPVACTDIALTSATP